MKIVLLTLSLLHISLYADILSPTGTIKFDSNLDSNAEMTLNSTGLGIGINPTANLQVSGNAIISKQLFVGGSSGSSNLNVNGTIGFGFQSISSNVTLGEESIALVDSSSSNITISLPYAANVLGRKYMIKKTSTSNEVIIRSYNDFIDSSHEVDMLAGSRSSLSLISSSNGQWSILASSSCNTLWSPAQISTTIWYDAADSSTVIHSNGNLSRWEDKSGNDNHAEQLTNSNQAETAINNLNGLNLITSRDGSKFMNVTNSPSAIMGIGVVVLRTTSTSSTIMYGGNSGTAPTYEMFIRHSSSHDVSFDGTNSATGTGKYAIDGAALSGSFSNGVADLTSADPYLFTGLFDSAQSIGSTIGRDGVSSDASGHDVGEIIWFSSQLSTSDQQKVEGYLAHKWGLQSKLDNSHPYKSNPPE